MVAESPYKTTEPFGKASPQHIPESAEEDRDRVRAYETYADIYHNVPDIFAITVTTEAGNDRYRRFVPSARTIVETGNRYLAKNLTWRGEPSSPTSAADPAGDPAVDDAAVSATLASLQALFRREEFTAKFLSMKRWTLIRGDGLLHVTADPSKPEGTRLRITELDPGTYFPITDPGDSERVVGCYIVNLIADDEGEEIAARLEYRRIIDEESSTTYVTPIGGIYMRLTFWATDGWDDRASDEGLEEAPTPSRFNNERFAPLLEGAPLPADITAIPVYHFRNGRRGGSIFGVSRIQGIETLIAGVNQAATDEDVAVALQGLGVYWTTSGKAHDEDGNQVPWQIAPAQMLELQPDGSIGRLEGVSSIAASTGHIDLLKREMRETTATPDVAVGKVDVAVAQSGVALAIQMAPILSQNEETEEDFGGKLDQMAYDLINGWLPAYEGVPAPGVTITAEFGPALPLNRPEIITEITTLVTAKVISADFARSLLSERLGYTFPSDMLAQITEEATALEDAMGARLDAEAGQGAEVGL